VNNAGGIARIGWPAYQWWSEALHGVARDGRATSFPQAAHSSVNDTALPSLSMCEEIYSAACFGPLRSAGLRLLTTGLFGMQSARYTCAPPRRQHKACSSRMFVLLGHGNRGAREESAVLGKA
jgi:hypothetical protein